ncbi:hypothetical protein HAX54_013236, partial [Datura stramonium]|nr:hypothetical protein [Datura stramonium]
YNTVHHMEKEENILIDKKQEDYEDIQTGDMEGAIKEIKKVDPKTGNESLDMKHVEVELEKAVSETIYVN